MVVPRYFSPATRSTVQPDGELVSGRTKLGLKDEIQRLGGVGPDGNVAGIHLPDIVIDFGH